MSRLLHLTAGYPSTAEMQTLAASSAAHGFDFRALPKFWPAERLAKIEKLGVVRALLESGEVRADRIILFTDAYDVLVLGHADMLEERFCQSGVDIMFSAEANFFPKDDRDPATRALFETFASKWRYLNSGCYVGYAWAILVLLRHAMSIQTAESRSDQMLTQEFFRNCTETGRLRVGLDTTPTFFGSLNASYNDFRRRGAHVYGPHSDLPLPVLHGNGDKDNLQILRLLWVLREADVDLRLLQIGAEHVRHDALAGRLARVGGAFADLVFAAHHANARAVLFTARGGCLTFTPECVVKAGRADVRSWETVGARGRLRTVHGRDLAAYFAGRRAGEPVLGDVPLALLREAEFAAVADLAARLAAQLAARPGLEAVV